MQLEPPQFKSRYQNMLDMKKERFLIKLDSEDPWGLVITSRSISWVQVWHNFQKSTLTLGLWGEGRGYVGNARPEDAIFEDTGKYLMFRWNVAKIDSTIPPHLQPEMNDIIYRIKASFDWVRQNRIRLT